MLRHFSVMYLLQKTAFCGFLPSTVSFLAGLVPSGLVLVGPVLVGPVLVGPVLPGSLKSALAQVWDYMEMMGSVEPSEQRRQEWLLAGEFAVPLAVDSLYIHERKTPCRGDVVWLHVSEQFAKAALALALMVQPLQTQVAVVQGEGAKNYR